MDHSLKISLTGLSVLSFCLAGCTGNGLRNIFSRNETAGYRSLAELDADATAEDPDTPDAESGGGPRFASWIPFSKKNDAADSSLADVDTETDLDAEQESSTYGKWWQRAFQKRDPYESDPFLAETETAAKSEMDATRARETAAKSKVTEDLDSAERPSRSLVKNSVDKSDSLERADSKVRTVSGTRATAEADASAANDPLVSKFEEHFRNNTLQAAEQIDDAEPLIVAGKKAATAAKDSKTDTLAASETKLAELEALLAERRATAAQKMKAERIKAASVSDSASREVTGAGEDFFGEIARTKSAAEKKSAAATSELTSFDLLMQEATGDAVASTPSTRPSSAASRSNVSTAPKSSSPMVTDELRVASADELFGVDSSPKRSVASTTSERKTSSKARPKSAQLEDGFNWNQTDAADAQRDARDRTNSSSWGESFASGSAIQPSFDQEMPAAIIRDTPDVVRGSQFQSGSSVRPNPNGSPFRTVSASQNMTHSSSGNVAMDQESRDQLAAHASQDGFFTQAPIESSEHLTSEIAATNDSAMNAASANSGFRMTGRHWLLLLGGLIVVALLFAPGRKKEFSAGAGPVQG